MNAETVNHPFGDIYAERDGARYLIGIKTGNKYQVSDLINPTYNVRKGGVDVKKAVAQQYNATLAWVAIAVVPEEQRFGAYFGTIAQIEDAGERFSILDAAGANEALRMPLASGRRGRGRQVDTLGMVERGVFPQRHLTFVLRSEAQ